MSIEFLKSLFHFTGKINMQENYSSNFQIPIKVIEEQIKILESINLSPLPQSKEDKEIRNKDLSECLIKIIFSFDIILQEKIKESNKVNKTTSKHERLFDHYWKIISSFFSNSDPVKFITNIKDENFNLFKEKGLCYLTIIVLDNGFLTFIKQFYGQEFDKKWYQPSSTLVERREDFNKIGEKLAEFHHQFSVIKTDIMAEYTRYKDLREKEKNDENYGAGGIDITSVSPILKRRSSIDGRGIDETNFFLTPGGVKFYDSNYLKSGFDLNNPNSMFQSKGLESKADLINSGFFKLIVADDGQGEEQKYKEDEDKKNQSEDEDEPKEGKEKQIPKTSNISTQNIMAGISRPEIFLNPEIKEVTINVVSDLNNIYKDEYFTNDKPDGTVYQKIDYKKRLPFERHFEVENKTEKSGKYTKSDIIKYKRKELTITNSILYFLNYFYRKEEYFKFNKKILRKPITLEEQNHQCYFCFKVIDKSVFSPFNQIYWCSYFMRYICRDCVSEEYSIIPAFVLKFWNFKKFSISKIGRGILDKWFKRPVIQIKSYDKILKKSSLLEEAIIIKRKIHKIFDLMKCEKAEQFAFSVLGDHKYLLLKENIFSLEDLVEIYSEKLIVELYTFFNTFENHILNECQECSYKGGTCNNCLKEEVLFAYNFEKVFLCNNCNRIYHLDCSSVHPCRIEINFQFK